MFRWSVCDCAEHIATSTHPSLVAMANGLNKESHRDTCASFLSSSGHLLAALSSILLPAFYLLSVCRQSDQRRSRLVWAHAGNHSVLPLLSFYTWNLFAFISAAAEILVCLPSVSQTINRPRGFLLLFLPTSSKMSILLSGARTMTAPTKHPWSEATTCTPQIASWAIFSLFAFSFSAIHEVQIGSPV